MEWLVNGVCGPLSDFMKGLTMVHAMDAWPMERHGCRMDDGMSRWHGGLCQGKQRYGGAVCDVEHSCGPSVGMEITKPKHTRLQGRNARERRCCATKMVCFVCNREGHEARKCWSKRGGVKAMFVSKDVQQNGFLEKDRSGLHVRCIFSGQPTTNDTRLVQEEFSMVLPREAWLGMVRIEKEAMDLMAMKEGHSSAREDRVCGPMNQGAAMEDERGQEVLPRSCWKARGGVTSWRSRSGETSWRNDARGKGNQSGSRGLSHGCAASKRGQASFNGGRNQNLQRRAKLDKSNVRCFNCHRLGHYARFCWSNNCVEDEKDKEEDPLILMTQEEHHGRPHLDAPKVFSALLEDAQKLDDVLTSRMVSFKLKLDELNAKELRLKAWEDKLNVREGKLGDLLENFSVSFLDKLNAKNSVPLHGELHGFVTEFKQGYEDDCSDVCSVFEAQTCGSNDGLRLGNPGGVCAAKVGKNSVCVQSGNAEWTKRGAVAEIGVFEHGEAFGDVSRSNTNAGGLGKGVLPDLLLKRRNKRGKNKKRQWKRVVLHGDVNSVHGRNVRNIPCVDDHGGVRSTSHGDEVDYDEVFAPVARNKDQLADMFTKSLGRGRFIALRRRLGMIDVKNILLD